MTYTLTQHARDAMEKRGIPTEWLKRTLVAPQWREPDATDPELEHRFAVISEYDHRVLRVIVNTRVTPERVVTLYFDRKMRGRL